MTFAVRPVSFPALRLRPRAVRRALLAGGGWGIGMGAALAALKFQNCGMVCLSDVALDTALAVVAGVATLGPLAAFDFVRAPPWRRHALSRAAMTFLPPEPRG